MVGGANVKKKLGWPKTAELKAINQKVTSCQTYIRNIGQFSILEKVFKTRISSFAFFSS